MWYRLGADAIVALHAAYVVFIVLGQAAILLGAVCRWQWITNPWFRLGHLTAIVIVATEAVSGIACPLTVWESNLRHLAGQEVGYATFMGRLMHNLIFFHLPSWVFTSCYVGFAVLVGVTLYLSPPRLGGRLVAASPQSR